MSLIEKNFVYVNGYTEEFFDDPLLVDFINEELGNKEWKLFSSNMRSIPEKLNDFITPDFIHGMCANQYFEVSKGGTFINPFMAGIAAEFGVWADIISEESFAPYDIKFLNIPYELYKNVAIRNDIVTEEVYNSNSVIVEKLVGLLNKEIPENRTLH